MIAEDVKVDILKDGRFIFLLSIIIELIYFSSSLTTTPPLLMAIIVFPSLLVLPGMMLLAVLRCSIDNMVKLLVEGFFVSTVMSIILTSFMLMLGFPLVPFTYSLAALIFVVFFATIGLVRKIEFKPGNHDVLLIAIAFLSYIALLLYFSRLPRLFTPDETSYIFSARMGILNGAVPPMGVMPHRSEVTALFQGRVFWIYLLASFIGSTGLPANQAGLLGVGFLIMTALASSLMVKNKWLSMAVFAIVAINPLLFSFSALTLNDLAISFYAVFAVLFFVKSFSKIDDNISISITNLLYSFIGVIVLTLIKPNLLVFAAMWMILVYIMLRYKLYKQNRKYKVLLMAVLLPVLIYELGVDIPYVMSVWILRSRELADLFGKFLFISPAEKFAGWFLAPWWNPTAPTLFTRSFVDYLDYFYRLLTPESSSLLISAFILALPILILSRDTRKELDKTVLASLVLLSLCLFYFDTLSSVNLGDVSRYALCMVPLCIPLALMTLQDIKDSSSFRKLLPVFITALILLWTNIWLSKEKGGVYVGYGLPSRLWTADAIMIQLISLTVILSLPFLREDLPKVRLSISRKLSAIKTVNLKNVVFCFVVILILLNGVYFSAQFMEKSRLYEDHGFNTTNDALNDLANDGSLVFANNYIYMRPYINDKLFKEGLLLPSPDTKEEFFRLLEVAPNNTLFLISDDSDTTWYEYGNKYIKSYAHSDIITPEKPNASKLPKLNLTEPILVMTFDEANDTTVIDHSDFGNNGVNNGAKPVEGRYGKAISFNGKEYVSIPNSDVLNVRNSITISFLAMIERAEALKGYMILSKGYAPYNGSYDVFVWDGSIYLSLGEGRFISVPATPFLETWHHYVFAYNGESLSSYVDGVLIASKTAKGPIKTSAYNLEIGRDSERKGYYFTGILDELQISDKPLNVTKLVESYFDDYAVRFCEVPIPKGKTSLFKLKKSNSDRTQGNISVKDSKIAIDGNLTITINLEIESNTPKDVAILVATDRFTKVYTVHLDVGNNNVRFECPYIRDPLWYEGGGHYWLHFSKPRIILIDENRILYNEFTPILNLKFTNVLLFTLTSVIVAFIILIHLNLNLQKTKLKRKSGR